MSNLNVFLAQLFQLLRSTGLIFKAIGVFQINPKKSLRKALVAPVWTKILGAVTI